MPDPYNRQYVTAGNASVAADGAFLGGQPQPIIASWVSSQGSLQEATIVWAEQYNTGLINRGQAILTRNGVMSLQNAYNQARQFGYTGSPTDPIGLGNALSMIQAPPPALPSPTAPPGAPAPGPGTGPITIPLGPGVAPLQLPMISPPVLIGGVVVVWLVFFRKGRR